MIEVQQPHPLVSLALSVLSIYTFCVIVWIVLSWLIAFNVVNRYNPVVQNINDILSAIIEPVLKPIRYIIPPIRGVDLAPLVLFLLIEFIKNMLIYYS